MHNSQLPKSIFELAGFQEKYKPLLYTSVSEQFNLDKYKALDEIDIKYLLMCASVFAESTDSKHLDTAYRISQYVIQSNSTNQNQKVSAAFILDKMTNQGAINLAIERQCIPTNFQENTPFEFQLDSMNRLIKYSIYDQHENIIPINKFQYEVLEGIRKSDWVSISAPTSAGKSFILLQQIKMFFERLSEGVIVYVVPTRALIQQVEYDVKKLLIDNKVSDTFVSTVPILDKLMNSFKKVVFVLTQERLQWLLNDHQTFVPDVLIIDEAQKIGDGTRGIILQQTIEDVARRSKNVKLIFSSPMTSNPGILLEQADDNLLKETIDKEQVTVNQNLLWVNQVFRKPKEWELSLCTEKQTINLGKLTLSEKPNSETDRLPFVTHRLADPNGGNLIYSNIPSSAEKCAEKLWSLQGSEKETKHHEIQALIELIKETVNPDYTLAHVLTRGVGYHYGNMPLIIKNEIERLFSEGILQFLVCTSTLIEGINLPAKNIFVRGPQKGRGIPMGEMDFWNLAGRAGRQGKEFQGNVICIDTKKEALWNYTPPKERKKYLIERTVDNLLVKDIDQLIQFIDKGSPREESVNNPELEYGFTYLTGEYIRNEGLQKAASLKKYSATTIERLDDSIATAIKDIEIPSHIILKHTGISPIAQQQLLTFFQRNELVIDMYTPVHPSNRNATSYYKAIIDTIQEMLSGEHPGKNYHYSRLVLEWMRGYPLSRIIKRNLKYWKGKDSNKSKQGIIRDTMKDIEEFARFKFIKYFACYRDILVYFLESHKITPNDELPDLNLWLELGASEKTPISLISLGFTRTTAISLADVLKDQNLDREECLDLLIKINWEKLSISPIILREITQVLKLYI